MKKLIDRNYRSIVKRGLIDKDTTFEDFYRKLEEECEELANDYFYKNEINEFELADVILVCLNMAKHYNINIHKVLNQKIRINETRS